MMSSSDNAPSVTVRNTFFSWGSGLQLLLGVMALGTAFVSAVTYVNRTDNRITAIELSRSDRAAKVDGRLSSLETRLGEMATLPLRVTQTETSLVAVNERVDRISQRLLDSIDALRQQVADLDKRVAVMNGKLDDLGPRRPADRLP